MIITTVITSTCNEVDDDHEDAALDDVLVDADEARSTSTSR